VQYDYEGLYRKKCIVFYKDPHHLLLPETTGHSPDLSKASIFFVGTANIIMKIAGFSTLTDPNFLHAGEHAHLGYGMKSKRLMNPALDIKDLPPLDLCLPTHMHGDHFGRVAKKHLNRDLPMITNLQAASDLRRWGFKRPHDLKTWEHIRANKGKQASTSIPYR